MKKLVYSVIAIIAFFTLVTVSNSYAGGPPPPPGGGGPPCLPPPCIPIDGGISFLVAAGVAVGAKKIYNSRKEAENKDIQQLKLQRH